MAAQQAPIGLGFPSRGHFTQSPLSLLNGALCSNTWTLMYIPKWTHAYYNILIDIMALPGVCMPSRMRRHHVYFALTGTTGRRFLRFSHILTTSFPETQAPPTSLRPCLRRLISTSDMWPMFLLVVPSPHTKSTVQCASMVFVPDIGSFIRRVYRRYMRQKYTDQQSLFMVREVRI